MYKRCLKKLKAALKCMATVFHFGPDVFFKFISIDFEKNILT